MHLYIMRVTHALRHVASINHSAHCRNCNFQTGYVFPFDECLCTLSMSDDVNYSDWLWEFSLKTFHLTLYKSFSDSRMCELSFLLRSIALNEIHREKFYYTSTFYTFHSPWNEGNALFIVTAIVGGEMRFLPLIDWNGEKLCTLCT